MAGHTITPYELIATRRYARGEKKPRLVLADVGRDTTLDLLELIEWYVEDVDPVKTKDGDKRVQCVLTEREDDDTLHLVIACDISGEREAVRDFDDPDGVPVFMKTEEHSARYYSCATVWRPSDGERGLLVVHSPWARGGSKGQILQLLQRAANADADSIAKLHASPKIPANVLAYLLQNAAATRITYRKQERIRSRFKRVSGRQMARAEVAVTIRGSENDNFLDAVKHSLRQAIERDEYFTIETRDPSSGDFAEERFDDVEITVDRGGTSKTYSLREDTIPSLGASYSEQFRPIYSTLPRSDDKTWAPRLLAGAKPLMMEALREAQAV